MDFTVTDENLCIQIQKLIDEFERRKAHDDKMSALSYTERVDAFIRYFFDRNPTTGIGFLSWYGMEGSSTMLRADGSRLLFAHGAAIKLPDCCKFPAADLALYFKDGEDLPCMMRGSLHAANRKHHPKYHASTAVFDRYIRKIKLTCLSVNEWRSFATSKKCRDLMARIDNKWNSGNAGRTDHFGDAVRAMVYDSKCSTNVIVEGESVSIHNEKLIIMRKLYGSYKKMGEMMQA